MKIKRSKLTEVRDLLNEIFLTAKDDAAVKNTHGYSHYLTPWSSPLGIKISDVLDELDEIVDAPREPKATKGDGVVTLAASEASALYGFIFSNTTCEDRQATGTESEFYKGIHKLLKVI